LSERITAAVSIREFIGQYVELSATGQGLCPFHDDHNPSFSVNDEENYWYCFACDKGGSIIDFWMMKHDCDFQTAVQQLAAKVLDAS
jgi:DNA primase